LEKNVTPILEPLKAKEVRFKRAYGDLQATTKELEQLTTWMGNRYYWADVLTELRRVLIRAEQSSQQKLKADAGIWIEQFLTTVPQVAGMDSGMAGGGYMNPMNPIARMDPAMERYMGREGQPPPQYTPEGAMAPGAAPGTPGATVLPELSAASTNQISTIKIVCRAVDLSSLPGLSDANTTIIYTLENELKASPLLEPKDTQIVGSITPDEATRTFTVTFLLSLKNPLKL
jgi:hypothetical protein